VGAAHLLRRALRHMEWADARVWEGVLGLDAFEADAGTHERLHHLHTVQRAYTGIWRGRTLELPQASEFPDLASLCAWAREGHAGLAGWAESLDSVRLDRPVEFPWAEKIAERWDEAGPVTLAESVLQVTSHTAHHRGQVVARIRELGGEPPLIDFVAWLWQGRPAPEWPDGPGG